METRWVLQLCHGYSGPFLDVARQYAALFHGHPCKVLTVYLTGLPDEKVAQQSASDEVIFLNQSSRELRGLKIATLRAVKKIVASRKFVLVLAQRYKSIYTACLATQLPVIGVHHAFGAYERIQRRWFARCFQKRLALLAVSDAVRDEIRRALPDWPHERIETLHNRIDLAETQHALLPRKQAREQLDLPPDALIIANVGRLHPDKDQATLIRAFALARDKLPASALLLIAGQGRLADDLRALIEELGVASRVRLLGQVPDVKRLFAAFDLFVLSSDHEPFGMVLLEAMAAQLPVMATHCGGAPEVVGDPRLLFELKNTEQLAEHLCSFFAPGKAAFRQEVSAAGERRVREKFDDGVVKATFFALPMVKAALNAQ